MQLKHMRPYQLRDYVEAGHPLLVPAGCIETHGPHMAIGHDTIIVEEICQRIAERTPCAIAPLLNTDRPATRSVDQKTAPSTPTMMPSAAT